MKKAISLLVAFATACSISVAAFAATDTPYAPQTRSVLGLSGENIVHANELYLVETSGKSIVGAENKLEPNSDYKFKIYYNDTGADIVSTTNNFSGGKQLTGFMVGGGTVRLRTLKGSSYISTAKIKTIGRGDTATYEFEITTREYLGTKLNDVEYALSVTGSTAATAATIVESTHTFKVGYQEIDDTETNVGEGGTITISNDRPVILKEQFTDIAKSANYKNVIFEGDDGNWSFEGKVAGMKDTNFVYDYDPTTDILSKFPDQEFKFLHFKAGVTFPTNGEMKIDVSDVSDVFGTAMHVYLYRNGKMTEVNSTHDIGADQVVFRTNYLGSFVITNKRITDTSIVSEPSVVPPTEEPPITNHNNPQTGASSAMNIALALGLTAIISAGAISLKK